MKKQFNNLKKILKKNISIIGIIVILLAVLYFMNKEMFFQQAKTTITSSSCSKIYDTMKCEDLERNYHEYDNICAGEAYERKCEEYDEEYSETYKGELTTTTTTKKTTNTKKVFYDMTGYPSQYQGDNVKYILDNTYKYIDEFRKLLQKYNLPSGLPGKENYNIDKRTPKSFLANNFIMELIYDILLNTKYKELRFALHFGRFGETKESAYRKAHTEKLKKLLEKYKIDKIMPYNLFAWDIYKIIGVLDKIPGEDSWIVMDSSELIKRIDQSIHNDQLKQRMA